MGEKYETLSKLNIEGRFLGFIGDKPGKSKYLQLGIPSGNVVIKIPKELRCSLIFSLVPGEEIRVAAVSKLDPHTSTVKLKAYQIEPVGLCSIENQLTQTKAKIMVCQKSGCMKKGGKALLSELEKTLCDRGLLDKVTIEHTNCQKRCSSAPNCILKLGKKQYNKIRPEAIASLLEAHLG